MEHATMPSPADTIAPKRLSVFERYLSLWVGLCMVVGVVLGLTAPGLMQKLRGLDFGAGSQINAPIAILIPSSRVRRAIAYDSTPYSPIAASNRARAPNRPEMVATRRSRSNERSIRS